MDQYTVAFGLDNAMKSDISLAMKDYPALRPMSRHRLHCTALTINAPTEEIMVAATTKSMRPGVVLRLGALHAIKHSLAIDIADPTPVYEFQDRFKTTLLEITRKTYGNARADELESKLRGFDKHPHITIANGYESDLAEIPPSQRFMGREIQISNAYLMKNFDAARAWHYDLRPTTSLASSDPLARRAP